MGRELLSWVSGSMSEPGILIQNITLLLPPKEHSVISPVRIQSCSLERRRKAWPACLSTQWFTREFWFLSRHVSPDTGSCVPKEREVCFQRQISRPQGERVSSQRQPCAFRTQRETKCLQRHGKLEPGQSGSQGKRNQEENCCWQTGWLKRAIHKCGQKAALTALLRTRWWCNQH